MAAAPGQERFLSILLLAKISATGFLIKGALVEAVYKASLGAREKRTFSF